MNVVQRYPTLLSCPACNHESIREVYGGMPYSFLCDKCGCDGDFTTEIATYEQVQAQWRWAEQYRRWAEQRVLPKPVQ